MSRLNEIEHQLTKTDLPRNSGALAEQHAYLSNAIVEVSTSALREGRILLERVGRNDPGVQGVADMVSPFIFVILSSYKCVLFALMYSYFEVWNHL